ncbi:MAG: phosphoribosylanthranilate isomerase [Christensenellaceae bacterium]|jgi:phosphoribosylanthranilate isomerase|nr:phosphoribosylanthranilate isomerase [Christensenellaceae bacterium]
MSADIKIKICGITRIEDIACLNESKPDYVGFVFVKRSKRYCEPTNAINLRKKLSMEITTVGVFDNEPITNIIKFFNEGIISIVQLHGGENLEYIRELRSRMPGITIIRAIDVSSHANSYDMYDADYLLLDNGKGGTGITFEWTKIKNIKTPYFLAGGINISNLEDAIKYGPYAIDVSSGVETDGYKDHNKIKRIIYALRNMK